MILLISEADVIFFFQHNLWTYRVYYKRTHNQGMSRSGMFPNQGYSRGDVQRLRISINEVTNGRENVSQ